jgi:hypothetical protein
MTDKKSLFQPAAFVRELEELARSRGWPLSYLSPTTASARPWLQLPAQSADAPHLYLSAGIHGDEIAGPLALLEMLKQPDFFDGMQVTLFPLLNPEGLARGVRENLDGIDLNRDYRNTRSGEILGHLEVLRTLPRFDAAMFLHEDFEETGAYLYELNESLPEGLGHRLIAAMARHVPIDLRPEIEEVPASGGVLQRKDIISKLGPIEERPEWPEAIYLSLNHTQVNITTETPMLQPLADRVAAQVAAVRTMTEELKSFRDLNRSSHPSAGAAPPDSLQDPR